MTRPASRPISFDRAGPSDAQPVVFLHGTRLTRASWTAQMTALADEFCVVAIDLPGHGVLVDEPFELETAADHVGDLIATVIGRPAVVVGLSLGGYVAMALAARRPDLVRGLVLSGATAEPIGLRAVPYRALAWALVRFDGARLDALNARFFRARFVPGIAEPILAGGFWSRGGASALRALVGERFAPRLAAYPGPTLIINGEYDLLFRFATGTFARAARDARRVRLRGATHLANLDRPEAFSEAVRRFVRSLAEPA